MKRTATKPELVYAARAELAEGPIWHDRALWWVDISAGTLNRLDPANGSNTARATNGFLSAETPADDGRWLIARRNELAWLDWETGGLAHFRSSPRPSGTTLRFNDGKCDAAGRFWVGTLDLAGKKNRCSLYCVEKNRTRRILSGISLSNGLAWSPSGESFFYADTATRRVDRFRFEAERGRLSERTALVTLARSEGWPDGITCDAEGNVWIACWGAGQVLCVDGRTGRRLSRIRIPATQVSSCAFGGEKLDQLFITTAWQGFSTEQRASEPLAGGIFAITTSSSGQPTNLFSTK